MGAKPYLPERKACKRMMETFTYVKTFNLHQQWPVEILRSNLPNLCKLEQSTIDAQALIDSLINLTFLFPPLQNIKVFFLTSSPPPPKKQNYKCKYKYKRQFSNDKHKDRKNDFSFFPRELITNLTPCCSFSQMCKRANVQCANVTT